MAASGDQADNAGPAAPVQDGSAEEPAPSFGGLEEAGAAYVHGGESVPTISVEDALVAEAGKAIDDGEYLRAAERFADAAKLAPDRVDYVMMRGHCLKDGGDFPGAFRAYAEALDAAPSGDPHIQLGHLFKITGNLNEARLAYGQGARLSEAVGVLELHNLGSISAAEFRLPAAAGAALFPSNSSLNWHAAIAMTRSTTPRSWRPASRWPRRERPISPRPFSRSPIWATTPELIGGSIMRLSSAFPYGRQFIFRNSPERARFAPAQRPLTARARLNKMAAATLAAEENDADEGAQSPPATPRTPDWPPEILTADVSETLLKRLMGALDRAYHAFSTQTQLSGAAAIEAVRALNSATHPFDHVVSFPLGGARPICALPPPEF